ncbi:hypothetical protein [Streptomyces sp. NPDC127190]|uniref:hypothetical protein n=1 Tax=Streptomyces sp. NPDC127190 TaxID=3345387 RepID=UPI00362F9D4D
MGERMSGGLVPGRRHEHPGGAVCGRPDDDGTGTGLDTGADTSALEAALAAALRGPEPEPGTAAEERARAAFRAAMDTGAHRARTRRRDDWRPSAERRAARSRRTRITFGAVFASLTLGGVAVAAIGTAGSHGHGTQADRRLVTPSAVAPDRPGTTPSAVAPGESPGPSDAPSPARDTEAHCRAYQRVEGRGRALDATVWHQLVTAAGGKDKVAAYCSAELGRPTATPHRPGNPGKPSDPGRPAGNAPSAKPTARGTAANGHPGEGRAETRHP